MNYFCIVKHRNVLYISLIISIISLFSGEVKAISNSVKAECQGESNADSVEISLLTCSPGTEVYSLYGHTAIRYTDYIKGIDVAVNYGMFSFKRPYFIPRFIFGLTDYEMGIVPFEYFYNEYKSDNRSVVQQVLNLTEKEKSAIISALEKNYLPENRIYRYNYFYDNCTTRARDIILNNIGGKVIYTEEKPSYPSFRQMIHSFNGAYPWAKFGNDMLLGVGADLSTGMDEHQFLPFNLKQDFDYAVVKDNDGTVRPLVKKSFNVIDRMPVSVPQDSFLRPSTCAWIVFGLIIFITLFEVLFKKNLWFVDTFLMFAVGCVGIVLFVMLFSQHPTTSTNLQILLFNPLPLFFIYRVTKHLRQRTADRFWSYAAGVIALFLIAGLFQQYAEGVCVLALSLFIRCLWRIIYQRSNDDK